MGQAFQFRSSCPISSVGEISGSLIEDCTISSVPAPIWTAPLAPVFPLRAFDLGCFEIPKPSSTVSSSTVASLSAWVSYPSSSETGCCEPIYNFFFQAGAGGCPTLTARPSIIRNYQETVPYMDINDDPAGGGSCAYEMNFNLHLPCIEFNFQPSLSLRFTNSSAPSFIASFSWVSEYSSSSDGSSWIWAPQLCQYETLFNLRLPHPDLKLVTEINNTNDLTVPDPCENMNTGAGLLISDIGLQLVESVNPNDPYTLLMSVTKNIPWICPLANVDDPTTMAEADPCGFYAFDSAGDYVSPGGTPQPVQDPNCPTKFTWNLTNIKKYKIEEQQTNNVTAQPRVNSNQIYELLYFASVNGNILTDEFCQEISTQTNNVWVPQDSWTYEGSSSTVLYTTPYLTGQIRRIAAVRNVTEDIVNPGIGSLAKQVDTVHVIYKNMWPFVSGGLTGRYKPTKNNVWFFEHGLLTSTSWEPGA